MRTQRAKYLPIRSLRASALLWATPIVVAQAQSSPFMTGATALQTNILAWLTPIAIILVMVLGAMAMANRMSWGWCFGAILGIAQVSSTYGSGEAQTLVENCGNTLILRCSGSEHGGTSQFASRLIGDREVTRITTSRSRRMSELFAVISQSEHPGVEAAVMGSEIEQLPDLSGYLKLASSPAWQRVRLRRPVPRPRMEPPPHTARILTFPGVSTSSPPERSAAVPTPEQQRSAARDGFELE